MCRSGGVDGPAVDAWLPHVRVGGRLPRLASVRDDGADRVGIVGTRWLYPRVTIWPEVVAGCGGRRGRL